jgi:ABC-type transporter Mla MlaB component
MSFELEPRDGALAVIGEVGAAEASMLAEALIWELLAWSPPALDLEELELLDGIAVAEVVNAIRQVRDRAGRVEIHRAPQMLAHTLYKPGLLGDGSIVLIDPRQEEGFGAS